MPTAKALPQVIDRKYLSSWQPNQLDAIPLAHYM